MPPHAPAFHLDRTKLRKGLLVALLTRCLWIIAGAVTSSKGDIHLYCPCRPSRDILGILIFPFPIVSLLFLLPILTASHSVRVLGRLQATYPRMHVVAEPDGPIQLEDIWVRQHLLNNMSLVWKSWRKVVKMRPDSHKFVANLAKFHRFGKVGFPDVGGDADGNGDGDGSSRGDARCGGDPRARGHSARRISAGDYWAGDVVHRARAPHHRCSCTRALLSCGSYIRRSMHMWARTPGDWSPRGQPAASDAQGTYAAVDIAHRALARGSARDGRVVLVALVTKLVVAAARREDCAFGHWPDAGGADRSRAIFHDGSTDPRVRGDARGGFLTETQATQVLR
ncbi:hypothetical protein B0H13DRAFT_1856164 [Mycena leptocephala]|nr:hypothetical protein B0H13DRAFT_1856164 [Mycena leptocephala]